MSSVSAATSYPDILTSNHLLITEQSVRSPDLLMFVILRLWQEQALLEKRRHDSRRHTINPSTEAVSSLGEAEWLQGGFLC